MDSRNELRLRHLRKWGDSDWKLLVLVFLSGLFIMIPVNGLHIQKDSCPPDASKQAVENLIGFWRDRILNCWKGFNSTQTSHASTAELLSSIGITTTKDYCYVRLRFDGAKVVMDDEPHCPFAYHRYVSSNNRINKTTYILMSMLHFHRAAEIAHVLSQTVVELRNQGRLSNARPFSFYFDATDGTRTNIDVFNLLRLPILSTNNGPGDRCTFPIPDMHQLVGSMNNLTLGGDRYQVTPHMRGLANGKGI